MPDLSQLISQMRSMMVDLHGHQIEHMSMSTWKPMVDIYEGDDAIIILVELPGVNKDQIEVSVDQGVLRIAGMRPKHLPESVRHVHQMEIPYGPFARHLRLPKCMPLDSINADYADGYLTIRIPKAREDE